MKFDATNSLIAAQMREVDRVAVEEFDLQVIQMMEIAAFQMARLVRTREKQLKGKRVLVYAGSGNNGGDAIACARYLHNWGAEVMVVAPEKLKSNAKHHFLLAIKAGVSVPQSGRVFYHSDVVIDGILGYSISGNVRSPYVEWIQTISKYTSPVYSYDIPSGLDPDDGSIHGIAVHADVTLTLAYPKKGLFEGEASKYVGELYLADIGIPDAVYLQTRRQFPELKYDNPFDESDLLHLGS